MLPYLLLAAFYAALRPGRACFGGSSSSIQNDDMQKFVQNAQAFGYKLPAGLEPALAGLNPALLPAGLDPRLPVYLPPPSQVPATTAASITLGPYFTSQTHTQGFRPIPQDFGENDADLMTVDGSRINEGEYLYYDLGGNRDGRTTQPVTAPSPVVRTLAPATDPPFKETLFPTVTKETPRFRFPKDCSEVQQFREGNSNGQYDVFRPGCLNPVSCSKKVYCDLETDGGGWTLVQQRLDDSVRFDRDWKSYKDGFGDHRNFWIGNEYLYEVTSSNKSYQLLIQLSDERDKSIFALYEDFRVGPETENYKLNIGTMFGTSAVDNLRGSRSSSFSSNDDDPESCGHFWESGWWHQTDCRPSGNLNVPYSTRGDPEDGILWETELGFVKLRTTQMKIRPTSFLT